MEWHQGEVPVRLGFPKLAFGDRPSVALRTASISEKVLQGDDEISARLSGASRLATLVAVGEGREDGRTRIHLAAVGGS